MNGVRHTLARGMAAAAASCLILCAPHALAAAAAGAGPGAGPGTGPGGMPGGAPAMMAQPTTPDDPAKVAAARQFLVLYHPRIDPKTVAANLDKYLPQYAAAAKKEDPKVDVKKYIAERRAAVLKRVNDELDKQAHVASRHFTLAELKQLAAFFSSPLGRKLNSEGMKIQRELMLMRPLNGPGQMQRVTIAPDKGKPHK
jgi:hypothetical protein